MCVEGMDSNWRAGRQWAGDGGGQRLSASAMGCREGFGMSPENSWLERPEDSVGEKLRPGHLSVWIPKALADASPWHL